MKILIIGGAGFLGSAVASRLVREGHRVVCLVRNPARGQADPGIEYVQGTLDDLQAIADYARDADYLLHFAWDTTPGTSRAQPTVEAVNNLLPTFRLIEQLHSVSDCRLVFVSSAGAIYDETQVSVADEFSPLSPKSYYGAGKLAVEMFLRAHNAQTGRPLDIVRPSNVYGPGQQAKRQFGIVPTLMRAIESGSTFKVWGTGEATRDYLFIADFAEFFVRLLDEKRDAVNVYNVAAGHTCSVKELCRLLERISGRTLSIEHLPVRGVDLHGVSIDCRKAREELDWQASTRLEDGLSLTWDWFAAAR